ncbi:MAG: tetratricopeptide repeat protein [Luteolibacter sp.]
MSGKKTASQPGVTAIGTLTFMEKAAGIAKDLATSLSNLANLLQAQGKLAEAVPLSRRHLS